MDTTQFQQAVLEELRAIRKALLPDEQQIHESRVEAEQKARCWAEAMLKGERARLQSSPSEQECLRGKLFPIQDL